MEGTIARISSIRFAGFKTPEASGAMAMVPPNPNIIMLRLGMSMVSVSLNQTADFA
jgi:hypothetical protein